MTIAYLSLGSNLGDREAHLRKALEALEPRGVYVLRQSSIYETEPRDLREQPWFLNLVAEVETALSAPELLDTIHQIEQDLGRERAVSKGPRTIDIDILFFGGSVIATDTLEVPHPRTAERRFVLEPLSELSPDLPHPVTGRTVAQMLRAVSNQPVKLFAHNPALARSNEPH